MTQSATNPFRPALGVEPPAWVGCDLPIVEWTRAIDSGQHRNATRWAWYTGSTGAGKTTLVRRAEQTALQRGWMVLSLSARAGVVHRLVIDHLANAYSQLHVPDRAAGTLIAESADLGASRPLRIWPALRPTLSGLTSELSSRWGGLVVTLDDVEAADRHELDFLITELDRCRTTDGHHVAVIVAGELNPFEIWPADMSSAECNWDQWTLGPLEPADVKEAIYRPIIEAGRRIDDEALDLAAETSGGLPLRIQHVGYLAWEHSPDQLTIDIAAVEATRNALADQPAMPVLPFVNRFG